MLVRFLANNVSLCVMGANMMGWANIIAIYNVSFFLFLLVTST